MISMQPTREASTSAWTKHAVVRFSVDPGDDLGEQKRHQESGDNLTEIGEIERHIQ
jgi:hypothetical protein